MSRLALILMLLLAPFAALAVQPDEVLDNPVLESRARDISQKMRCPVCQGESIDESNAGVSRDLRLYIRERLVAGDSDAEVVDAVVDRFGEFVLFDPPMRGINLLLWFWPGESQANQWGEPPAPAGIAARILAFGAPLWIMLAYGLALWVLVQS